MGNWSQIWERAKSAESAYSIASWGWAALLFLFPVGGIVTWAATYRDWIWNDHGMLGAICAGLAAMLVVSIALFILAAAGFLSAAAAARFQSTRSSSNPIASAEPTITVSEWLTPSQALEQFTDLGLRQKAVEAVKDCNALFVKQRTLSNERTSKILNSEYNALDAMVSGQSADDPLTVVTKQYNDSQLEAALAKRALENDLIRQLKDDGLVAKGVRFDEGKAQEDWEYIKSAYWVALTFDSYGQDWETVSGGGKTFKGLRIGKPVR